MIKKIPYSTREEWLKLRRNGIGGSEAAAIAGLSQWSSPLAVYLDKLGITPEREDNEAMRQGRDLEAYVADRFAEKMGLDVRRENHILVNTDLPWMHANIDRRITGMRIGLECKTTSVYNKTDFEGGDVPNEYYIQCQHYMAVTGWDKWYLAVIVLNRGFYTFEVERNEEDIQALIEMEKNFWYNHVQLQIAPAPMAQDSENLKNLYPSAESGFVPMYSISKTIQDLVAKKEEKKAVEAECDRLENVIKAHMGVYEEGSDDKYLITWKNRTANRIDSKRLKAEQPQIYDAYTNESTARYFLVKEL